MKSGTGRGGKVMNGYAEQIHEIYAAVPKAVLAAIAVSFATSGGDRIEYATDLVLREWRILHENGIVPQKPPRAEKVPADEAYMFENDEA